MPNLKLTEKQTKYKSKTRAIYNKLINQLKHAKLEDGSNGSGNIPQTNNADTGSAGFNPVYGSGGTQKGTL